MFRTQPTLTPRFCMRCGGRLAAFGQTYRCTKCGTTRERQPLTGDYLIIRPSQLAQPDRASTNRIATDDPYPGRRVRELAIGASRRALTAGTAAARALFSLLWRATATSSRLLASWPRTVAHSVVSWTSRANAALRHTAGGAAVQWRRNAPRPRAAFRTMTLRTAVSANWASIRVDHDFWPQVAWTLVAVAVAAGLGAAIVLAQR